VPAHDAGDLKEDPWAVSEVFGHDVLAGAFRPKGAHGLR
jgi:hypothetical protein